MDQGIGQRQQVQGDGEGMVSLTAEVPEPLLRAMRHFIERHPNWDQYRLFQAALAGFLVQSPVRDRDITRCYLANLFPSSARFQGPVPVGNSGGECSRVRHLPRQQPGLAGELRNPASPSSLAA
ncbi:MAG: DUF2811 domain-containing protein [Synechococcaceae cyanobacterium]|nr:DUF2811 domain-containing protein [Synechococcaceae cyanobacterium]